MPGPSRRSAPGPGSGDRRARAQRARQNRATQPARRLARRVSWSRRVGIASALLLLVGSSIALAGGALNAIPRPRALVPVPPVPALLAASDELTRAEAIDVHVWRPSGLRADQRYVVRIYAGEELVRERDLPSAEHFVLENVPLRRGVNALSATLAGSGGEGLRSTPIIILRDDVAPVIEITAPDGAVFGAEVVLAGRTEPGADLTLTREPSGRELDAFIGADGRFRASVELSMGENAFSLHSVDPAGNEGRKRVVIVRGQSTASVVLTVSDQELSAAELPQRITLRAAVRDELGRPIDGVNVTFGLSPPNQTTRTLQLVTEGGVATWPGIDLEAVPSTRGTWLATVLVTLESGLELRDDESISVE